MSQGVGQSHARRHDGVGLSMIPSAQRADAPDMSDHNF
jgi:hypothetical protein